METGIHVGASQGTIEATSKAIMQILGMTQHEQGTIQRALSVLAEITRVPGPTNITGNTIYSDLQGKVDVDPEVLEYLKTGWARVTADESGKVEVSETTAPRPKKRSRRK